MLSKGPRHCWRQASTETAGPTTLSSGDDRPVHTILLSPDQLSPDALRGVIEDFVTRDGTDYGAVERSVEEKAADVRALLVSGEAQVVFNAESESVTIVLSRDLAR